jgi:hypothetical protein
MTNWLLTDIIDVCYHNPMKPEENFLTLKEIAHKTTNVLRMMNAKEYEY